MSREKRVYLSLENPLPLEVILYHESYFEKTFASLHRDYIKRHSTSKGEEQKSLETLKKWYNNHKKTKTSTILLILSEGDVSGQIRFFKVEDKLALSIFIDKNYRRRGIASTLIKEVIKSDFIGMLDYEKDLPLLAYILKDNQISIKLFKNLGFEYLKEEKYDGIDYWLFSYQKK